MLNSVTGPLNIDVRELAHACAGHPGVRLVVLFGSVVTGKARADSDADVAILGGEFWEQLEMGSRLGKLLGREPHVVDLHTASDRLRFEVARGGLLVFESPPGEWTEFKASAMVRYWDLAPIIAICAAGVEKRLRSEARQHG
jgi:predicted nucleotidyltransferase